MRGYFGRVGPALACVAVCLCARPASAQQQVIYNSFTSTGGFNGNVGGWSVTGTDVGFQEIAVPFTVGGTNLDLSSITIAIGSVGTTTGYNLEVETSASGKPSNTAIESFNDLTPGGSDKLETPESIDSVLKPLLLANTTYWVVAAPNDPHTSDAWDLNSTGHSGFYYNKGSNWISFGGTTPALEVTGAPVPEAATVLSFGGLLAAGALATMRRRRKV